MELSGSSPVSLPPPVLPGDRVGVAALSGPIDPGRLAAGLAALRALGFEPVEARNLSARATLFAGDDDERLDAFHTLAADPTVKAIFFARGGHGVLRLLPAIDWTLLARTPRAYVGYSDLTPFLHQVVRRLGIAAFHGPMVAADLARGLDDAERSSLLHALAGDGFLELPLAGISVPGGPTAGDAPTGAVEGPLAGGCLAMLTATLGTPWAPVLDDALVLIEEIDEPLYRIDRMLTHLRLSGTLTRARALIFGHRAAVRDGRLVTDGWRRLIEEVGVVFDGPLAWGLPSGHLAPNLTLPLGLRAWLEPEQLRLRIPLAAEVARG